MINHFLIKIVNITGVLQMKRMFTHYQKMLKMKQVGLLGEFSG